MSHSTGIPTVGIAKWPGGVVGQSFFNEIGDFLKSDDIV